MEFYWLQKEDGRAFDLMGFDGEKIATLRWNLIAGVWNLRSRGLDIYANLDVDRDHIQDAKDQALKVLKNICQRRVERLSEHIKMISELQKR
jgi:hypothetical protein